ncbi:MAG: aldehyde ferredoxin oxidoreductase C-terminal domain-containing protein, partial [Candidatus Thorarchaeota archaeon]|nr:aldehyde ferredoxin oxidoreductase C-terminal domain-containing protein [Candidatus Thorarchaeota archaeon]
MLKEFSYEVPKIERGYASQTLYVNVGTNEIKIKPVDDKMKETFTGGKGFDLWLMWNGLPKDRVVKWDDPENEICIATGPLGGVTQYPGAGKSIVTSISPMTGIPIDSNVGGYFGPHLKFSGFDAMELQGKADKDVYVFIDGDKGKISIHEATDLPDTAYEITRVLSERHTEKEGKDMSVVTSGPAAEHAWMGCLNFSWWDMRRNVPRYKQAGRGGIGTVFRNKNIKALVCKLDKITIDMNGPADEEGVKAVGREHSSEILELDKVQNRMRVIGTGHLPIIMDEFDLLPTRNFRTGGDPEAKNLFGDVWEKLFSNPGKGWDGCWRPCAINCSHCIEGFQPKTGPFKGQNVVVDGPEYETIAGCGSNLAIFDPHYVAELNFYCDAYGIDTISFGTTMGFVMELTEEGHIDEEATGGHNLKWGAAEEVLAVLHEMAEGKGFGGEHFGKGTHYLKKYFSDEFRVDGFVMHDIGMEHKGLEYSEYVTKESLAQQGGYGLALKGPQHDEAWLIFLDQVHNYIPTFENKAEALHYFPMWRTWFGLNGLCKLPWNDVVPADNKESSEPAKVPRHVEFYARFFEAMTGRPTKGKDLIAMSEKVYNFQRIFNIRQGKGCRENDSFIPYRSAGPVTDWEYESRQERYDGQLKEMGIDIGSMSTTEKNMKLRDIREERYRLLTDAAYKRRGWTRNGVPTLEKVKKLGLDWVPGLLDIVEFVVDSKPPKDT